MVPLSLAGPLGSCERTVRGFRGLTYNGQYITLGAQHERLGDAGPVSGSLSAGAHRPLFVKDKVVVHGLSVVSLALLHFIVYFSSHQAILLRGRRVLAPSPPNRCRLSGHYFVSM